MIMKKLIFASILSLGLGGVVISDASAQTVSQKACDKECCAGKKVTDHKPVPNKLAPMYKKKHTYKIVGKTPSSNHSMYYNRPLPSSHEMREARYAAAYERQFVQNNVEEVAKERTQQLHKKLELTPSQEKVAYRIYKKEAKKELELKELRQEHREILKDELTREQWKKYSGKRNFR